MNVHVSYDVFTRIPDSGMARFLSPVNLRRYRRLAAQKTSAAERNRLFKLLAREWASFIGERHSSSLDIELHGPNRKMSSVEVLDIAMR